MKPKSFSYFAEPKYGDRNEEKFPSPWLGGPAKQNENSEERVKKRKMKREVDGRRKLIFLLRGDGSLAAEVEPNRLRSRKKMQFTTLPETVYLVPPPFLKRGATCCDFFISLR